MVSAHLESFQNKPVKDYSLKTVISPDEYVYRLRVQYDDKHSITDLLDEFANQPQAGTIRELIIGSFATDVYSTEDSVALVSKLVELKDNLSGLKAIFIGDITYEECEISWIYHENMEPVLQAWPDLEHFQVRGGDGLNFENLEHAKLKTLIIETGGLPPNVVKQVGEARLPNLEKLEMWLGSDNYGFNSAIEDFAPILSGKIFPKLIHLGLMDSEIQDEIAIAVAKAPILTQLKVLDLSMGTLTDKGASALLGSEGIGKLRFLNLRHHFLSDDMMDKLKALGVPVNLDDKQDEDEEDRFVEVAE